MAIQRILRKAGRPGFVEPLFERAALIGPVAVIVTRGDDGANAREVRRMRDGGQHLRCAHIGSAQHSDSAIGVRERGGPFNGVVAVVRFVLEGVPFAVRRISPANILDDDDIPVRCGAVAESGSPCFVVRSSLEQDRIPAGLLGPINVGAQDSAVPHGSGHSVFDNYISLLGL